MNASRSILLVLALGSAGCVVAPADDDPPARSNSPAKPADGGAAPWDGATAGGGSALPPVSGIDAGVVVVPPMGVTVGGTTPGGPGFGGTTPGTAGGTTPAGPDFGGVPTSGAGGTTPGGSGFGGIPSQ